MPSSADLVVRVLADTSGATSNVNALVTALGKVAGVGAGAAVGGSMVSAAMQVQDAMARVQTAYNNADFAPGTAKFAAAQQSIQNFSQTTATSFSDAAAVYAQGARYINDAGQRLDPTQLDAYTDTMLRLAKVSSDNLAPEDVGQQVDVLAKLFGTTNFAQTGSEISALSGMHNQGEEPGLQAAISIGQVGADIGVTQQQALGVGNYLADLQLGGQMGGSSIGRMLQRMNTGADNLLDPDQQAANVKQQRDASEKMSDLQDQLQLAQMRQSQMYGQHGLKTEYKRDPAAVAQSDMDIAKLQREISDQSQDMTATANSSQKSSASSANIGAMAKLLGANQNDFAQQFQSDPMGALLQWTNKVGQLPQDQQLSAMRDAFGGKAGNVNVRDQRIISALSNPNRQDTLQSYLDTANAQAANPTDLGTRSAIPLATPSSQVTDVQNALYGQAAVAGTGPANAIGAGATDLLKGMSDNTDAITKLDQDMTGNPLMGIVTTGVVSGVTTALPLLLSRVLLGGGGGGAAAGVAGGAAAAGGTAARSGAAAAIGTAGPVGVGNFVGAGASVAGAFVAGDLGKQLANGLDDALRGGALGPGVQQFALDHLRSSQDVAQNGPSGVNIGDVHVQASYSLDDILSAVTKQITMAWNQAQASQPVAGQVGGLVNVSGQGPR